MWRSRSLAEWERKKSYLIRSLFEDIPILSPILEGPEPTSPSSPSHYIYRPESPLPELIIEIEPKKPNLHDEPAELYDELAKEMRRLYRKDFLDIELSTSSCENSSAENLNRGRIYDNMSDESDSENVLDENVLKDRYQIDYGATEHQNENDIDSPTLTEISTSTESSESMHIASKSVIVQVDIHSQEYEIQKDLACEQQGFKESYQYIQSGDNSINVSKTTTVNESIEVGDDSTEKEERSDSYSFAKHTDASSSDSNSDSNIKSSHASPEIMRERPLFESLETPPHRPVSKSNSTVSNTVHLSMEVDSKEFSEDVLASNQEIEIAEGSRNETLLFVTSTPTRKRLSRSSTERRHKRRLVSYSSSSSFASAANAALQTSFSDCETDARLFWSNIFVGMPTVYNICSCNDHVCT